VALLRLLCLWRERAGTIYPPPLAHLDHGLRGEEGAADAPSSRDLPRSWGSHSGRSGRMSRTSRGGEALHQDAARRLRYAFSSARRTRWAVAGSPRATTREDAAETLLLRLARGAGRRGLGGLRPVGAAWSGRSPMSRRTTCAAGSRRAASFRLGQDERDPSTRGPAAPGGPAGKLEEVSAGGLSRSRAPPASGRGGRRSLDELAEAAVAPLPPREVRGRWRPLEELPRLAPAAPPQGATARLPRGAAPGRSSPPPRSRPSSAWSRTRGAGGPSCGLRAERRGPAPQVRPATGRLHLPSATYCGFPGRWGSRRRAPCSRRRAPRRAGWRRAARPAAGGGVARCRAKRPRSRGPLAPSGRPGSGPSASEGGAASSRTSSWTGRSPAATRRDPALLARGEMPGCPASRSGEPFRVGRPAAEAVPSGCGAPALIRGRRVGSLLLLLRFSLSFSFSEASSR